MNLSKVRDCPICSARPTGLTFPYATRFNDVHFGYLKCGDCKSVFVDPVPDAQTFELMYAKSGYHDLYYNGGEGVDYSESVRLLRQHLEPGATVLDYGCGVGSFLKACSFQGLVPLGVEFDGEAALFAAKNANCEVMTVETFSKITKTSNFDAIHMGDVLEHLPDPAGTLSFLIDYMKPGGILFLEGPLEANSSPVFWATLIFGMVKRLHKPTLMPNDPPTHLLRTNAHAQKTFFTLVDKSLSMRHWQVYETGWPYGSGGFVKRSIAAFAIFMGGRHFAGTTLGNRFKAILVKV